MPADEEAILEANDAFYRAFDQHDLEALAAVWASHAPVACIHPGWAPLQGRESVIASWKSIMEGQPPRIACFGVRAYVFGDAGFVICSERLEGGTLAATNVVPLSATIGRLVPACAPFFAPFSASDQLHFQRPPRAPQPDA